MFKIFEEAKAASIEITISPTKQYFEVNLFLRSNERTSVVLSNLRNFLFKRLIVRSLTSKKNKDADLIFSFTNIFRMNRLRVENETGNLPQESWISIKKALGDLTALTFVLIRVINTRVIKST